MQAGLGGLLLFMYTLQNIMAVCGFPQMWIKSRLGLHGFRKRDSPFKGKCSSVPVVVLSAVGVLPFH